MAKKPKKPTRIEKGILLAVVYLANDLDQPTMAANLARSHGVHNLDVSDAADFDKEVYAELNKEDHMDLILSNDTLCREAGQKDA